MKSVIKPSKTIEMKHLLLFLISILLFALSGYSQTDSESSNTQKVKVLGHAHMDPVYRWRWNESNYMASQN